ncbi:MAG: molybdopterin molybdotransferase MoeA [Chloroflexi bacterium]|nr:molybdopterin molybdotransferase MoeA [Chloroflexota bacterium]MBI3339362.1 molybdopterin molybdotransferase MoeA [Chloroflexota bacterium]
MPEFLTLLPPDEARALLLSHLSAPKADSELIDTIHALGRVTAQDILAPHPLPEFPRSTVDGYAVRARDTFGAADSLPAYLNLIGEVPMGGEPSFELNAGQCALIHTGGMLPDGAEAVVMLEQTQSARPNEIEIMRAVAEGENVIRVGEDVAQGQTVIRRGVRLRPAEIGGLMALGIVQLQVVKKIRVGLISSGDEVVEPSQQPHRGQVRDVNAYTLAALVTKFGGEAVMYGIVPDDIRALKETAARALSECDVVIITAGSSASTRDMTAEAIASLGKPGVLVHGINTRPGKPTILGACAGKAVIGLPGNPVSALVNGYLFVAPVIEKLLGLPLDASTGSAPRPSVMARLTVNIPSQAGREDWIPVKLLPSPTGREAGGEGEWLAEPIFGKSNLIFTLAAAHGLLRIPPDATGVSAGEAAEIMLL